MQAPAPLVYAASMPRPHHLSMLPSPLRPPLSSPPLTMPPSHVAAPPRPQHYYSPARARSTTYSSPTPSAASTVGDMYDAVTAASPLGRGPSRHDDWHAVVGVPHARPIWRARTLDSSRTTSPALSASLSQPPSPMSSSCVPASNGSSSSGDDALAPGLSKARPRGDDGRFVTRAFGSDDDTCAGGGVAAPLAAAKTCGWCHTTRTSQWRVGPTGGSAAMSTLCNACGINYRRAVAKWRDGGLLNLDVLARELGSAKLSIQKAIKRQRKMSACAHAMKRHRTVPAVSAARAAVSFGDLDEQAHTKSSAKSGATSASRAVMDAVVAPATRARCAQGCAPGAGCRCHLRTHAQAYATGSDGVDGPVERRRADDRPLRCSRATRLPDFRSFLGEVERRGAA